MLDAILLSQSESLHLGGSRNLRSFITSYRMLAAGIGVIPLAAARHPTPTTTLSASAGKGKEKMVAGDQTNAEQARKRRRGNDGSQLIPIDHVVDLTGPDAEPKKPVLPPQPKNPVLTNMSFDDRMFVEFSNLEPRAEGRYVFGQTPASMWCSTSLKASPNFSNLTHWSDLVEAGHLEALKAGVYYHQAFLAAEQEMKRLASDRDEGQMLLSAARKLITDVQDHAKKGERTMRLIHLFILTRGGMRCSLLFGRKSSHLGAHPPTC
ncbi:unnamed protein product [Cuscuta europaea]|uniref:Uncharacterized protein n=1 Tax=Cuscuta europaea TaxID=41803 RepID=A0A9P0Z071_CUSEU|nr:unnamed protein product [Cuscuta europaea]